MMHIPKKPRLKWLSSSQTDATFLGTLSCTIMQTCMHFADSTDDGYACSLRLLATHLCDFLTLLPPPLGEGPDRRFPAVGQAHMHEYYPGGGNHTERGGWLFLSFHMCFHVARGAKCGLHCAHHYPSFFACSQKRMTQKKHMLLLCSICSHDSQLASI